MGMTNVRMKIKTFITINILCLLGLIGIYVFSNAILLKNIEDQEKKLVIHNINHVTTIINRDIAALNATSGDWSFWDDAYYFVRGENKDFIKNNLDNSSVSTLRLNLMVFLDNNKKVVYAKGFDLNSNREVEPPMDFDKYISSESSLLKHEGLGSIISGISIIDGKPMLLSSRPISTSNLEEPMAGTLIMGRYIDAPDYMVLQELTGSNISITELANINDIDSSKKYIVNENGDTYKIYIVNKEAVLCDLSIKDINGNDTINLRMKLPRDTYNNGYKNLILFMKIYTTAILVISFLAMIITDKVFIKRLERLSDFIKKVGLSKDMTQRICVQGRDEITNLAESTNNMLQEINHANIKIRESQERLQRVLEGSNDGFWDIYLPTGSIFFSPKLLEILEYDETEIKNFLPIMKKILSRDEFLKLLKAYRDLLEGRQESYAHEHHVKIKNGSFKWLLIKGKVVKWDENSKPLLMAGIASDITEVKKRSETIEYLSYHDALTGLYNRHYFITQLEKLNDAKQLPISLIMGDVNGLKLTNDAFGHLEGDKLLVTIAEILNKSCRKEDIVARLGGDEFIIILPNADEKLASGVCNRIKAYCEEADQNLIKPSIALGVFTKNNESQDIDELFELAEDRMYKNKLLEKKSARHSTIAVMERALFEIDFETKEHTDRICKLAVKMGEYMNLPVNILDELKLLSKLHDIGKTAVPREILIKPERLTEAEWQIIKKHPEIGCRIALSSDDLKPIAEGILSHHEKWDGSGYPRGLKGEEIILSARIISIIDSYDVITNSRPYKKAATHEEAINEIIRCSGTHFDPQLVEIFKSMFIDEATMKKCL